MVVEQVVPVVIIIVVPLLQTGKKNNFSWMSHKRRIMHFNCVSLLIADDLARQEDIANTYIAFFQERHLFLIVFSNFDTTAFKGVQ
jgi:hypothetical protein